MAKSNRDQWLVRRRVTTGDVIVVPRERRRPEPAVEPKAAAPADAAREAADEGTGESYRWWEEESNAPDLYTPAGEEYAFEFGTGRRIRTAEER